MWHPRRVRIGKKPVGPAGLDSTSSPSASEGLKRALHVPFGLKSGLSFTLPSFRRTVTAGLILLTLATSIGPVAAATAGASRVTTNGAKIELFEAQSGPGEQRFERARAALDELDAASNQRASLTANIATTRRSIPYLETDIETQRLEIEAWTLPDTTGLESYDKQFAIEDAQAARSSSIAELEAMKGRLAEMVASVTEQEGQLADAEARVARAEATVAPLAAEALAQLKELGLRTPRDGGPNNIGYAAIVETWMAASGRSFVELSASEQAWLGTFERWATGGVDEVLARLNSTPANLLEDVVALALAAQPTAKGIERATAIEAALSFEPNAIDMALLDRLDDAPLALLTTRAKALEDAGLEWTTELRVSPFNGGPSALTDFASLSGLSLETPKFWIDPPSKMGARSVEVSFEALVEQAQAWKAEGRTLTADAVPLLAILARGGEGASRARALLERVPTELSGASLTSLAHLATGRFKGSGLDEEAFRAVDAGIEILGRRLHVGEINALADGHFAGKTTASVLPADLVAAARKHDPNASMDDLYVWSVAKPQSREALVQSIRSKIGVGASRLDRAAEYSERFVDHVSALSNSDLMRIDWLLDALKTSSVQTAIRGQIAADIADGESELGGVFVVVDGQKTFTPLASDRAASNNAFVFPKGVDPYQSIVTAHLHATTEQGNAKYAGPSSAFGGRVADRGHAHDAFRSDVVITLLDGGRFGVDYYTPEGAVVDLGSF